MLRGVEEMGFTCATPVQQLVIPYILRDKKDVIAAAQTGSGKTSAFGLPILETLMRLGREQNRQEQRQQAKLWALILVPTRELALQVSAHISDVGKHTGVKLVTITGGLAEEKQQRLLNAAPEIVVATPGRLWAMLQEKRHPYLNDMSELRFLVIDEADRMLQVGYFAELQYIFDTINAQQPDDCSAQRHTLLFSATLDVGSSGQSVAALLKFRRPLARVDLTSQQLMAANLTEMSIRCSVEEKDTYLVYSLMSLPPGRALVFVNAISSLRRLVPLLRMLRIDNVNALHAEQQQRQRLKNLDRFREAERGVLVATDVASRGLDIPAVHYVFHYQTPRTFELYVHRSGRTARASRTGVSIEMVSPSELGMFNRIQYALGRTGLPEMPVNVRAFNQVRKRVEAARKLESMQHLIDRRHNNNTWYIKAAEAADIILDKQVFDKPSSDELRREYSTMAALHKRLEELLAQHLDFGSSVMSIHYPTMNNDPSVAQLFADASKKKNAPIPLAGQVFDDE